MGLCPDPGPGTHGTGKSTGSGTLGTVPNVPKLPDDTLGTVPDVPKTVDDFDDLLKVMNTLELTEFQYLVSGDEWTVSIR